MDTTLPGDSQEAIKQSSAARRRFLLLFDKSCTDPAGLARARKAAKEFVLQGLRGLGSSLQRIPGRKQILYFSTGFSSTLLAGQDTREQKRMSEAIAKGRIWEVDSSERYGDSAFRGEVDGALLAFTRSDSVIHTIDLSGLGTSENYAQLPVEAQPSRDASGRDSLGLIAAQTGGRDMNQSLGIVVQVPDASMGCGAGALELFGYAMTRSGAVADHFAHFIRLDASDGSGVGATSGVSFAGRFDVPPGDYTLKFLVQRASGEASTRYFDVTVPKRQAAQGFLLPPLFEESAHRWLAVDLKKGEDSGLPIKINLGGTPFVPRTEITVRPGRAERLVLVSYDPETAEDPAADVDIRSSLSDDAGNRFPPGLITVEHVLHDTSGKRLYVLKFIPDDVPAGDYILRLHLGEANSLLQSYCRLTVVGRDSAAIR